MTDPLEEIAKRAAEALVTHEAHPSWRDRRADGDGPNKLSCPSAPAG